MRQLTRLLVLSTITVLLQFVPISSVEAEIDTSLCHIIVRFDVIVADTAAISGNPLDLWMNDAGYVSLTEGSEYGSQDYSRIIKEPGKITTIDLWDSTGVFVELALEKEFRDYIDERRRSYPNSKFLVSSCDEFEKMFSGRRMLRVLALLNVHQLEYFSLGSEVLFFDNFEKKKLKSRRVEGRTCDVWKIESPVYKWTLFTDRFSKHPKRIEFKSELYHFSVIYKKYECGLPFDSSLFVVPDGIEIRDATSFIDSLQSASEGLDP